MAEQREQQTGEQQAMQAPQAQNDFKGALSKLRARAGELLERQRDADRQERAALDRLRKQVEDQSEQNRKEFERRAAAWKSDVVEEFRATAAQARERMARMKAQVGERKSAHDAKAAERRAERAEDYAAAVIAWVSEGLDEAEIAVFEAMAARADAEQLRQPVH